MEQRFGRAELHNLPTYQHTVALLAILTDSIENILLFSFVSYVKCIRITEECGQIDLSEESMSS